MGNVASRSPRGAIVLAALLVNAAAAAAALFAPPAAAQVIPPLEQFKPTTAPTTAPAVPGGLEEFPLAGFAPVKAFEFHGNTRIPTARLDREVAEILARNGGNLTWDDVEEARVRATLVYVNAGYINSGAVLPERSYRRDTNAVRLDVIEGKLNKIEIAGHPRLKRGYLESRIWHDKSEPLDALKLRNNLELLRQNPNVQSVNAELRPGEQPGQSVLDVQLTETVPWQLGLQFDNNRSPSVGAERFSLVGSHTNVLGYGDALSARWGLNKGRLSDEFEFAELDDVSLSYSIPLNRFDTTLIVSFENSDAPVVEEPFAELDIRSRTQSYTIGLRQPLYRSPSTEFAVSASLVRRDNKSFLAGEPFSFSPGTEDGRSTIAALRVGQEFLTRTQDYALALRSTFTFGLDVLDATTHGGRARGGDDGTIAGKDLPDGQYWAWLGQAQYVRRLPKDLQLILRGTAQLTDQALLPLEQFSLGGVDTVRGYRENQLVRDVALAASAELRIPLIRQNDRSTLDLAVFADAGWAKNNDIPGVATPREEFISSAGLGLLWNPTRHFSATLYWGHPFKNFDQTDYDLQDSGLHFSLIATLP